MSPSESHADCGPGCVPTRVATSERPASELIAFLAEECEQWGFNVTIPPGGAGWESHPSTVWIEAVGVRLVLSARRRSPSDVGR